MTSVKMGPFPAVLVTRPKRAVDAGTGRGYIARPTDGPHNAGIGRPIAAQVAELVDAQVSGTCGRKVVEVRVFSWAPNQ
jgi:hypothetical protein